jgi:hypothetical protein
MKRTALIAGWTGHGAATSRVAEVSLRREPWHRDPPPREHQRPTEPPMYARRATFGASGQASPDCTRK